MLDNKRVLLAFITLTIASILIKHAGAKLYGFHHPQSYQYYRPRQYHYWNNPSVHQDTAAWDSYYNDLYEHGARRPSYLTGSHEGTDDSVDDTRTRRPAYFVGSYRDDGFGKKRKYAIDSEAAKNLFNDLYYHPF